MRVRHVPAQVLRGLRIDLQSCNIILIRVVLVRVRPTLLGAISVLRRPLLLLLLDLLLLGGLLALVLLASGLAALQVRVDEFSDGLLIKFLGWFAVVGPRRGHDLAEGVVVHGFVLAATCSRGVSLRWRAVYLSALQYWGCGGGVLCAQCRGPQACPMLVAALDSGICECFAQVEACGRAAAVYRYGPQKQGREAS